MRLEQLQYIVEIAQSGSISLAAERLHITQPSLSLAIINLEKELDVTLFNRSRQGIQLTEIGEAIVIQAKEILIKIDQLRLNVNTKSSILTGNLSISAVPSVCLTIMPKVIAAFIQKHPNVKLILQEKGTYKVMQDIKGGKSDLGIIALPENMFEDDANLKMLETTNIIKEKLYSDELLPCVGKNSSLSINEEIAPEDIIKYPFVLFNSQYLMPEYVKKMFKIYGDIDILLTTENSEIAKKMIIESNAIGFFSKLSLKEDPYSQSGQIIPLQIKNTKLEIYYSCIREHSHFSTAAQEFTRILKSFT